MGLVFTLEEAEERELIDDGTPFTATLVEVQLQERKKRDTNETLHRVGFKFRLKADDDFDGVAVWGSTSTKFVDFPGCKLKAWAEALLGQRLPPHYKLDTDSLIDRDCIVVIEKNEWTDPRDGSPRARNQVGDVLPTPENATALAADIEPF